MVDPDRKINRLTEKDVEFLDECDMEYAGRYSEEDDQFMMHCMKALSSPPIVENWLQSSYFTMSRYGAGKVRPNRNWQDFSADGGRHRAHFHRGRRFSHNRFHEHEARSNQHDGGDDSRGENNTEPMNVRRDYGNFVPASKD